MSEEKQAIPAPCLRPGDKPRAAWRYKRGFAQRRLCPCNSGLQNAGTSPRRSPRGDSGRLTAWNTPESLSQNRRIISTESLCLQGSLKWKKQNGSRSLLYTTKTRHGQETDERWKNGFKVQQLKIPTHRYFVQPAKEETVRWGWGGGGLPSARSAPGTPRGRAGLHAPNTLQRNTQNKTGEQSWGQRREPRVVGKMESRFALHGDVVALDWTPNRREGRTQRTECDKEYFLKRHGAFIKIIIP